MPTSVGLSSGLGVAATYKTGKTLYRMWESPTLRNYYFDAISAAQRENAPAFIKNYNKLNKELEKSEPVKQKAKSKQK